VGIKTAGVGHFTIPTAPAAGTSCTSGAANVFTGTYVQLTASTSAAIFITGLHIEKAAASAATYCVVQLATGGAGSETIVGQYLVALDTASTVALNYRPIFPPIPVATTTRIAVKTADSVGAQASLVTLECINQSNVVDDGVAVGTVTTVTNQLTAAQIATGVWQDTTAGDFTTALSVGKSVMNGVSLGTGLTVARCTLTDTLTTYTGNTVQTGDSFARIGAAGAGLTALGDTRVANLDATVSSRMATYTQPTGFLAATFPATVASTTNITAGTITTATNLTNLPSIPANWITATGITAAALNGKGDWLLLSGYTAPDNASITTLTTRLSATRATNLDNLDATVSSRFASASYTAPDNASVTAIKAKTDSLTFTVAGFIDANILKVKGITVTGTGAAGSTWGP
jgi:hypothetical protein